VFCAVKQAVDAFVLGKGGDPSNIVLNAPCSPVAVLNACEAM
jgi:hypothetical protein